MNKRKPPPGGKLEQLNRGQIALIVVMPILALAVMAAAVAIQAIVWTGGGR